MIQKPFSAIMQFLRIPRISGYCIVAVNLSLSQPVSAQSVDIVGLGAAVCQRFLADIAINPTIEREYLAWAQGYLSGLLIRAPKGVDENLKLLPPDFHIRQQAEFLVRFCRKNPNNDYVDGVQLLYKSLRKTTG